ncbi:NAD(+) diphosphatase [Bacteroides sp. 224]|uniref:NAD(+) diphosphatase n=1 Tax=Bacteroides sp. 224 TaxID=2302936 RepID=UPI0013D02A3C|nr:NAD(+) diphosphatase [Bacteroides sp. 224]NDV66612.1 NAD(+) diphosphatase [Bacteroides sp. 224]
MNTLPSTWWFIFHNDQLLLEKKDGSYTIPRQQEIPVTATESIIHEISTLDNSSCKALVVPSSIEDNNQYLMVDLRSSYDYLPEALYNMAGKASEILYWDKTSTYCPVCGTQTKQFMPIAKKCPTCSFEMFPAISTAILALVRKGDSVLLVRARNFRGPFHGLVAGFLETGESLEECAQREVLEETGLTIKNVTYFGSQPWPFPSGLMVGFIADYESGEIQLQEEELTSAAFYSKDNLPELPRKLSLARKMIDWWLENS